MSPATLMGPPLRQCEGARLSGDSSVGVSMMTVDNASVKSVDVGGVFGCRPTDVEAGLLAVPVGAAFED